MIDVNELGPRIVLYFGKNLKFHLSEGTLFGFILAAVLAVVGIWLGSSLQKVPRGKQVFAEALVSWIYKFADENLERRYGKNFAPFLGSLFIWLIFANSFGLLGQRPITADINVTAGLAVMCFTVIQVMAIKNLGIRGRVEELGDPFYGILPINIISEFVFPFTLALRLFGNIFGGMIVIDLWMKLMEYLSYQFFSIPILRAVTVIPLNLFFDIFEPLVQAYIFITLTAINLEEGLSGMSYETAEKRRLKREAKKYRKDSYKILDKSQ